MISSYSFLAPKVSADVYVLLGFRESVTRFFVDLVARETSLNKMAQY